VPFTPTVEGRALLFPDGIATLFMVPEKATPALTEHLGNDVTLKAPADLMADLAVLASKGAILADPRVTPLALFQAVETAGGRILRAEDPCTLPKALKNAAELEGARNAHRRDGAALTGFLAWLDGEAPGTVDELSAAAELYRRRSAGEHFQGLSFETISGAGPNGAVIHYRADRTSNRVLEAGALYLVDSGAQYLDGTTDVTRTIAISTPSEEAKACFTRVLKGHIAIARARFPRGTTGAQLDSLARLPLWEAGLDYDHGTGHGVGSYLGVHEGPQGISRRAGEVPLLPGMIVSNEPGYYKPGGFGIRIESLVAVREDPAPTGARPFLSFETLTLAPLDRRLIDRSMLTPAELTWLDAYHARVRTELAPLVDAQTKRWLDTATTPLTEAVAA
jgi:Xaa-Pro aminopeptidase